MGKSLQRHSICMDSNIPFGLPAHRVGKQTIKLMENIFKATAGLALMKDIFCINIKGCTSSLYSWTDMGSACAPFLHRMTLLHLEIAVDV